MFGLVTQMLRVVKVREPPAAIFWDQRNRKVVRHWWSVLGVGAAGFQTQTAQGVPGPFGAVSDRLEQAVWFVVDDNQLRCEAVAVERCRHTAAGAFDKEAKGRIIECAVLCDKIFD